MGKKVSVVIPVYNGMPKIKLAISSLQSQTYLNWEAIIIDDGSNDGTAEYLDSLTDPRFIVYHFEKNYGRPYARQKALDIATGDYLAMLDADDFYAPDKLKVQVELMEQYPEVDLVSSGLCSWGTLTKELRVRGLGDDAIKVASSDTTVVHASSMLRMNEAKKYKYNMMLKFGQDQDFLHRYLDGKKYIVQNSVLYYYSEFDSVNRRKIINTHLVCCKKAVKQHEIKTSLVEFIKYVVCSLIYPFMSDEQILLRRGQVPTDKQASDFHDIYNNLIRNIE